jgi:carboxyl-terminal processing protease
MQRIGESKDFYKEVLDKPFDYSVKEDFNTDYEKLPYAKTVAELKEKWRKQIKLSTLSSLTDKLKMQEDLKNGVVNDKNKKDKGLNDKTGKSPATLSEKNKDKTFADFEKNPRELAQNHSTSISISSTTLTKTIGFRCTVNAIATRFDHTNYFPPDEKERFDVSMSGSSKESARDCKKKMITEVSRTHFWRTGLEGRRLEAGTSS